LTGQLSEYQLAPPDPAPKTVDALAASAPDHDPPANRNAAAYIQLARLATRNMQLLMQLLQNGKLLMVTLLRLLASGTNQPTSS